MRDEQVRTERKARSPTALGVLGVLGVLVFRSSTPCAGCRRTPSLARHLRSPPEAWANDVVSVAFT